MTGFRHSCVSTKAARSKAGRGTTIDELSAGEVVIKAAYSGVNYKMRWRPPTGGSSGNFR